MLPRLAGFSSATGGTINSGDSLLAALGKLENRVALDDAKADGSTRVLKAGDTMTGALQFSGPTNPGVVLSTLTSTQRSALAAVDGMMVFDSTLSQLMCYVGSWSPLSLGGVGTTWFAQPGAPDASLGQAGNWCLDTSTGNIYQNNLVASVPTWQLIYAPSVSGFVPLGGGAMTGALQFSGTGNPGLRLNNLTTTQQNALSTGAGTLLFNTTLGVPAFYNGSSWFPLNTSYNIGTGKLQYFNGTAWTNILTGNSPSAPVFKGANYTMAAADSMVILTAGALTITLPASPVAGQVYYIMDSVAGSSTVATGTAAHFKQGTSDFGTSYTLNDKCDHYMFDGTNWWIIAEV